MDARPAECLKCPHPAATHGPGGCTPPVGMCACDVPGDRLPRPSAWETSAPTPPPAPAAAAAELPQVQVIPPPEPDPETLIPPRRMEAMQPKLTTAGRHYDWTSIKRRYVEGVKGPKDETIDWPSLNAVADYFGVDDARVRERSAAEGWVEARRQFQAKLEQTRQAARIASLTKKGIDLDDRAVTTSTLGLQLAQNLLAVRAQEIREASEGNDSKRKRRTIDALELSRIASAVDLFHKIGLRAIGDPQVTRLEVTGAGGSPIEIATELRRDDPNRLTGVLAVLQQAGLGDLFGSAPGGTLEAHSDGDGGYEAIPPRG